MRNILLCAVCIAISFRLLSGQVAECTLLAEQAEQSALASEYRVSHAQYVRAMQCCHRYGDQEGYFNAGLAALDCLFKSSQYKRYQGEHTALSRAFEKEKGRLTSAFQARVYDALRLFRIVDLLHAGDTETAIYELRDLGDYYQQHPAYDTSVYYQQRAVQVMKMLAEAYYVIGDYNQALVYNQRTQELAGPHFLAYSRDGVITEVLLNAAQCQIALGDHDAVGNTFDEVRSSARQIDRKRRQRTFRAYATLFAYYLERANRDSALVYLHRLADIDTDGQYAADIHKLEGDFHKQHRAFDKAERAYMQALSVISEHQGEHTEASALCKLALGNLYMQTGRYHEAATVLQASLIAMSNMQEQVTLLHNPPLSALYLHRDIPEVLLLKSRALTELHAETDDQQIIEAAWDAARLGVSYVRHLRTGYLTEEDKERILDRSYAMFEHALGLAYHRYNATHDTAWIDSAFVLMEFSKSLNLLDAVLHAKAQQFTGIPDSMRANEALLRREIVGLEKVIRTYRSQPSMRRDLLASYQDTLRQKLSEHKTLLDQLARQFPNYYRLVHDTSPMYVDPMREVLGADQVLIEYFYGDRGYFTIAISRQEKQFSYHAGVAELEAAIATYTASLHTYTETKSDLAVEDYVTSTHSLYNLLLSDAALAGKRLLIVADGPIGYVAIPGLLTEAAERPYDLRSLPYLLWDHEVAYCYSAKLFAELQSSRFSGNSAALACAPEFRHEAMLPNNEIEAARVAQILGGTALTGAQCTAARVLSMLSEKNTFGVLHLATHGKANVRAGDESYVVLSGETDSMDSYIYARELYNTPLHVNMVFLGSCESGTGERQRGEGIVSLARAFFYAGARSMITSLWVVEDHSALQLTTAVYRQLKKAVTKDYAIAEAQREYLRALPPHERMRAHPVYWAGFMAIGNTAPLPVGDGIPWGWALFLIACLVWCFWERAVGADHN